MIIFPARCYHAGMFNITDKISERLIAQISAELWQEALLLSLIHILGILSNLFQEFLIIYCANKLNPLVALEMKFFFQLIQKFIVHICDTVSYTHLDVYKRQLL